LHSRRGFGDNAPMRAAASSSDAPASAADGGASAARRWSGRRLLKLLERLGAIAIDIRAKARERAEQEQAKLRKGGWTNTDARFGDPQAVDHRFGMIVYRLIGVMARWQLRASSARGAARANAPGAVEKRREAAAARAEAKAAFVRNTGLASRYAPLQRPLGQPAPPRRSAHWRYLQGLAEIIEGEDDRTVVVSACTALTSMARMLGGEEKAVTAIESLGRAILAELDAASTQGAAMHGTEAAAAPEPSPPDDFTCGDPAVPPEPRRDAPQPPPDSG